MASLGSLPSDCISNLLEYLNGDVVYALLSTGDRVLRTKVTYGVRRLRVAARHNQNFPFSALKLPQLQHLHVSGYFQIFMRFDEDETSESSANRGKNRRERK